MHTKRLNEWYHIYSYHYTHKHARLDANPTQIINEQKLQNEHNKSGSQREKISGKNCTKPNYAQVQTFATNLQINKIMLNSERSKIQQHAIEET